MKVLFLFILLLFATCVHSQKKVIDNSTFDYWPEVQSPQITPDGKFASYIIDKHPINNQTLVLQSTENHWREEIIGANASLFTPDSKYALYKVGTDTLCVFKLGKSQIERIPKIQSFRLFSQGDNSWVAFKKKEGNNNQLVLRELKSGKERLFNNVSDFYLSDNGNILVTIETESLGRDRKARINRIDLIHGRWQNVFEFNSDKRLGMFSRMDSDGKQLAFEVLQKSNSDNFNFACFYFKEGMSNAVELINSQTAGLPNGSIRFSSLKFSRDGTRLFFRIAQREKKGVQSKLEDVNVDVWSHKDHKLQPLQLNEAKQSYWYDGVLNLDGNNQPILFCRTDTAKLLENTIYDDYALLRASYCDYTEDYWRPCGKALYFIDTKNGNRFIVKTGFFQSVSSSPTNNYVVYYEERMRSFYSFNTTTGKTTNVSKYIPVPISWDGNGKPLSWPFNGIGNWFVDGRHFIIYDEYDIWKVDAAGIEVPICLSNGFGRKNGTVFRFFDDEQLLGDKQAVIMALRQKDKANGFYQLNLLVENDPVCLTMQNYIYCWPFVAGEKPIKAISANTWLIKRLNATEAPNYFVTRDFRNFHQLSNVQPQAAYNWLTSELHEWTMANGRKSQGILYKPENFDPKKKYPLIFHFYERKSDELNKYLVPEATGHALNIPFFVSMGYLVFIPDIFYKLGEPSNSILNSVTSARNYIKKLTFIDASRIGMQGHSYGGYEVNVLAAKSDFFAAGVTVAGLSNFISEYGSINGGGTSNQFQTEFSQLRIGATPWSQPHLYIKNSPIFFADKVSTPLLITHGTDDRSVPFGQAVEWFTALRRLNKKAWMLQYNGQDHSIANESAADHTFRMTQFFDHYLKDSPAPVWMTNGIPGRLKGVITGYDLDPAGACGKDCKVCKIWNDKYLKDSVATMQEIQEKIKTEHWMGSGEN